MRSFTRLTEQKAALSGTMAGGMGEGAVQGWDWLGILGA